jgi:hypothetical protein
MAVHLGSCHTVWSPYLERFKRLLGHATCLQHWAAITGVWESTACNPGHMICSRRMVGGQTPLNDVRHLCMQMHGLFVHS